MAIHNAVGANRPKPRQPTLQTTRLPAPTRGIDARASAAEMAAENSLYSYNMVPAEYGLLLRRGYREWTKDCVTVGGEASGVNTLMAYDGIIAGPSDDKLFAVTKEGIWDATAYDTPPVLEAAFLIQDEGAGYGVSCHYVDQSGESFLLYADELNGLWEYSALLGTWARPTGIVGPDVEHVAFVVVHKQRLWLIEEDEAKAWYLPIASKMGTAEEFFFGSKFPHGGRLRGLYNWSVDGGAGVDDYLVAISSAGDITPYKGEDPSSADSWSVVGTYYVGRVPRGRSFVGEYAGDLYILCSFGLIAMSDLLRGVEVMSDASNRDSLSYKIARPIREDLANTREDYGWEPKFMPAQGVLLVQTPQYLNTPAEQWTLNLATQGWGKWRGVPMTSAVEWHGEVYFGDGGADIHVMDIDRDGVTIPISGALAIDLIMGFDISPTDTVVWSYESTETGHIHDALGVEPDPTQGTIDGAIIVFTEVFKASTYESDAVVRPTVTDALIPPDQAHKIRLIWSTEMIGEGFVPDAFHVSINGGTSVNPVSVDMSPENINFNGLPIEFSILTSYQDYGAPTQFKIPQYLRPDFFAAQHPSYRAKAVFDYNISEPLVALAAPPARTTVAKWDYATWDAAVWGGEDTESGKYRISGASGMGRAIAIAIRGEAISSTRLLSIDVMWQNGGPV